MAAAPLPCAQKRRLTCRCWCCLHVVCTVNGDAEVSAPCFGIRDQISHLLVTLSEVAATIHHNRATLCNTPALIHRPNAFVLESAKASSTKRSSDLTDP